MARQKTREKEHVIEIADTFSLDPAGIVEADFDLPWHVVMTAPSMEFRRNSDCGAGATAHGCRS
jgi:predicted Ser/Thr protein kinase